MALDLGSALPTVYSTISTETDITSFCRICATTGSGSLFSIFSQEGELWDVAEKIGRCLPIIVCIMHFEFSMFSFACYPMYFKT